MVLARISLTFIKIFSPFRGTGPTFFYLYYNGEKDQSKGFKREKIIFVAAPIKRHLSAKKTNRLLEKSSFSGCSKRARCKAPEILKSEAYLAVRRNDEG
jgi:hypothetical protein